MDETLTSSVSVPAMCGAEIVPLLVVVGLFLWGRSVADKHGTRGWRLASWMPIAGLVVHHPARRAGAARAVSCDCELSVRAS